TAVAHPLRSARRVSQASTALDTQARTGAPDDDASAAPADARPEQATAPRRRTLVLRGMGALLALVAIGFTTRYAIWAWHHESTDDAFVDCHVVRVSPRVAGR